MAIERGMVNGDNKSAVPFESYQGSEGIVDMSDIEYGCKREEMRRKNDENEAETQNVAGVNGKEHLFLQHWPCNWAGITVVSSHC